MIGGSASGALAHISLEFVTAMRDFDSPMNVRTSVAIELERALDIVEDGAVLGIGGAVTSAHPMALVRALARRGARELTVVAPTGGIDVDLLIAAGCVKRVVTSYVGIEAVAPVGPVFRRAAESGTVEIVDLDEAHCVMGLRAAGHRLPFMPWRGGVGTSFPTLNPSLIEFDDPVSGQPLLAVPAIELDVAFIYADRSDTYGNVQFARSPNMDALMGAAARSVVVQVERIVSTEDIARRPELTHFWRDTKIVRAPWGTHPYSSESMCADEAHLSEFGKAARDGGDQLDAYLARYVLGPPDHEAYLESVGLRRLLPLML
jgi:glutaconate CoA-transferase, subunit A